MKHIDLLFRFECPRCEVINGPVVEVTDCETIGLETVTCVNCKREFKISWEMKVQAVLIGDEAIEIEGMIWDDDDEEDVNEEEIN